LLRVSRGCNKGVYQAVFLSGVLRQAQVVVGRILFLLAVKLSPYFLAGCQLGAALSPYRLSQFLARRLSPDPLSTQLLASSKPAGESLECAKAESYITVYSWE